MNESLEPSRNVRCFAKLLAIVQLIFLGPITFASTLASTLLCFSCICYRVKSKYSSISTGFIATFNTCMSSWGLFWMFMLVVVPIVLTAGSVGLALGLAIVAIIYPCYAAYR
jgi:hypothetical protein